ncbi:Cof-type HAD-IIB family hydrolase [Halomonas campisalis]|uniref:Cof-type HAD-IIB family hydrolase n=1 Tax=Billgrantia campisalis TaxID=74661 RepID=A0ABS9P8I9_9GAMM|nr:Cof-type HAD-IIB family hydrolase [Halomonas campisalis]MCG6657405.1 Cof-type HAD-IIB family hydrolase [Halomonas campisalis]MDR5863250.1 Cof-type HAD-IIB family hydrolase [Halomonas campisalis]
MTPRLIVSDLDGTLLGADHDLDPATIDTLRALAERGHHLAFASGRHFRDMLAFRDRLRVPIHIISTNGAYLHGPEGDLLAARHLDSELARELIALERPSSVRLNLYHEHEWLIDAPDPGLLAMHAHTGFGYRVAEPGELASEGVGKVLYIGEPQRLAGLEARVREQHGERLHVTYSTVNSLEIMAGGVNKGTALASLLDALGLGPEACLAFGDNLNDTEMLALAGEAHVMANAHPDLPGRVPHARRIGHHAEVGVAASLRKRFEI